MGPLGRPALLGLSGQQWTPHSCSAALGSPVFLFCFVFACCHRQLNMSVSFLPPSSLTDCDPRSASSTRLPGSDLPFKSLLFSSDLPQPSSIFLLRASPHLWPPLHGPGPPHLHHGLPAPLLSVLNPFPFQLTLSFSSQALAAPIRACPLSSELRELGRGLGGRGEGQRGGKPLHWHLCFGQRGPAVP